MMLTHYNILLSSINTLLSQIFAPGWLLHHHGFIVAFVSANIIYLIIVKSSSAPLPVTPTNIDVVVITAARQVVKFFCNFMSQQASNFVHNFHACCFPFVSLCFALQGQSYNRPFHLTAAMW
jgi:hypothetical protein